MPKLIATGTGPEGTELDFPTSVSKSCHRLPPVCAPPLPLAAPGPVFYPVKHPLFSIVLASVLAASSVLAAEDLNVLKAKIMGSGC